MAAAAYLNPLADRLDRRVRATRFDWARSGARPFAVDALWPARLAHDVRQRLEVVGSLPGRVPRQPYDIPASRHDQPGRVLLAQVITVRLDVCRQRSEHGRGVAVHVRERVDGRLLARGT